MLNFCSPIRHSPTDRAARATLEEFTTAILANDIYNDSVTLCCSLSTCLFWSSVCVRGVFRLEDWLCCCWYLLFTSWDIQFDVFHQVLWIKVHVTGTAGEVSYTLTRVWVVVIFFLSRNTTISTSRFITVFARGHLTLWPSHMSFIFCVYSSFHCVLL